MKNLLPANGEVYYVPELFNPAECKHFYQSLISEVLWEQKAIKIFGKEMMRGSWERILQ